MMITRLRELTPEPLVARAFGLVGLEATLVTTGVAAPVLALSALRRVRGASLRSAA